MSSKWNTGVTIALEFVLSSQIYPFMLSSAFTARTVVKEKNQEDQVQVDMYWALGLSIGSFAVIGFFTKDMLAFIVGTAFAIALFFIYQHRGELSFW